MSFDYELPSLEEEYMQLRRSLYKKFFIVSFAKLNFYSKEK